MNDLLDMTKNETITLDTLIEYRNQVRQLTDRNVIATNIIAFWCIISAILGLFSSVTSLQAYSIVDLLLVYLHPYICVIILLIQSAYVNEKSDELKIQLSNKLWRNDGVKDDAYIQANMLRLSVYASMQSEPITIPIIGISWSRKSIVIQLITVITSFTISFIARSIA